MKVRFFLLLLLSASLCVLSFAFASTKKKHASKAKTSVSKKAHTPKASTEDAAWKADASTEEPCCSEAPLKPTVALHKLPVPAPPQKTKTTAVSPKIHAPVSTAKTKPSTNSKAKKNLQSKKQASSPSAANLKRRQAEQKRYQQAMQKRMRWERNRRQAILRQERAIVNRRRQLMNAYNRR